MRHSHGPTKSLFCRRCWWARFHGLRFVGYATTGQRMYGGPPVSNERSVTLTLSGDRASMERAFKPRQSDLHQRH